MPQRFPRTYIQRLSRLSYLIKGIDGVLETIGSILLAWIPPATLNRLVVLATEHELSRDPEDGFAKALVHAAQEFSVSSKTFACMYLASHGLIKIIFALGLLKKKAWAYPFAVVFLVIFITYQFYRFTHTHSRLLLLLAVLDLLILFLVWLDFLSFKRTPR